MSKPLPEELHHITRDLGHGDVRTAVQPILEKGEAADLQEQQPLVLALWLTPDKDGRNDDPDSHRKPERREKNDERKLLRIATTLTRRG